MIYLLKLITPAAFVSLLSVSLCFGRLPDITAHPEVRSFHRYSHP